MTLVACVDKRMGMMFNGRRQSSDRAVIERILQLSVKSSLWIKPYSEELFSECSVSHLNVSSNYMSEALREDFCFMENPDDITGYEKDIDMMILYNWNRDYPYDKQFSPNMNEWIEVRREELEGNSHSCITETVFVRNR